MDASQAGTVDDNELSSDPADTLQDSTDEASIGENELDASYNKPVYVHFDTQTKQFYFDPETVLMEQPGNVRIRKFPGSGAKWSFVGATITDPFGQFPVESTSANVIVVKDKFTRCGTYCYTVTVRENGVLYTSPDPYIRNSNPSLARVLDAGAVACT